MNYVKPQDMLVAACSRTPGTGQMSGSALAFANLA